jgi:8-oxo-dGTP pyrophosphatase MutT (NUDIX family)
MNQSVDKIIHGEIPSDNNPGRKDYLIRVSLKSVIFNEAGKVLVVKEKGRDWWDIPGGGIDHGESIKEVLARELYEEVSLTGDFEYEVILVEDPRYIEKHNLYQMRITFLVKPKVLEFATGEDGDEIMFIDPLQFKHSELITERKIFEYSDLASRRAGF